VREMVDEMCRLREMVDVLQQAVNRRDEGRQREGGGEEGDCGVGSGPGDQGDRGDGRGHREG